MELNEDEKGRRERWIKGCDSNLEFIRNINQKYSPFTFISCFFSCCKYGGHCFTNKLAPTPKQKVTKQSEKAKYVFFQILGRLKQR